MIPTELRKIIGLAFGVHGTDASDADCLLSQALGALHTEAEMLCFATEDTSIGAALSSHVYRIKALEELFDGFMVVRWEEPAAKMPEAAE